MVKLLSRVRYLCTSKNTRVNGWTTRHNERGTVNDIQTKYQKPDQTKDNIFLKPKDDRTYGGGWMTVWRLDTGELNDSGKTPVRWWKQRRYNLGRYHGKAKEMQIEALKRLTRGLKEMYGEENIISAVIHVDETTPHLH